MNTKCLIHLVYLEIKCWVYIDETGCNNVNESKNTMRSKSLAAIKKINLLLRPINYSGVLSEIEQRFGTCSLDHFS